MGKGGGALNVWLKEFITLVFTQTIQAFIYAIIIIIIMYGMKPRDGVSNADTNAALGLMATFALLSVFKVEDLAKKIFGIGDTKASHKNAMKSIAKTAIAAKLGGRVLNNAGKVFGGIRSMTKARQDRAKAQSRLKEDMADNGYQYKDGKAVYVGNKKTSSGSSLAASGSRAGLVTNTTDSSVEVGSITSRSSSGASGDDVQVGAVNTAAISDAAKRRMKNALRSYEDKLSEIDKARDEGIKSIASGLTESFTSLVGATAGGILGGSDGNIDELLQGVLAGAGAGDIAGKYAIEGIDRATKFVKRQVNHKKGISSRELEKTIKTYQKALEEASVTYGVTDVSDI